MPHGEEDGEGVVDARVDVEDDGDAHRITVARRAVADGTATATQGRATRAAASADQAHLVDLLAEEWHVLVGAVGREAVARVEAVRARVVDATQR